MCDRVHTQCHLWAVLLLLLPLLLLPSLEPELTSILDYAGYPFASRRYKIFDMQQQPLAYAGIFAMNESFSSKWIVDSLSRYCDTAEHG